MNRSHEFQSIFLKQWPKILLVGISSILVACSGDKEEPTFFTNSNPSSVTNGLNGQDGESCWEAEGVFDKNEDGVIDAADCIGAKGEIGEPGAAGVSCWSDIGDANQDGELNSADCRYSVQHKFPALEIEQFVQGQFSNILVPDDVESIVVALQKPPTMASVGRYCVRINLEKLCGDVDGCSMLLVERATNRGDDLVEAHRWQILPENYDLFFNPANQNQIYTEKNTGLTYRSLHAGSVNSWATTGFASASLRTLAWSQGSHVLLENYARADCENFNSSHPTNAHSRQHVFTLSVWNSYMGLMTVTDVP